MKILFTKTGIEKEVSAKLGNDFSCSFMEVIRTKIHKIQNFDLENQSLIFTSKTAVEAFEKSGFEIGIENKIFVVGKKTKNKFESTFKKEVLDFTNAEELSDCLRNRNENFLHFCGNISLDIFQNKENYKKIIVYNTELLYPKISEKYDSVCFFSPSGVRSFAKFNSLENLKIFSIGKTTEKELKKFTKNRIYTSKESNLEDLLKLLLANNELSEKPKLKKHD